MGLGAEQLRPNRRWDDQHPQHAHVHYRALWRRRHRRGQQFQHCRQHDRRGVDLGRKLQLPAGRRHHGQPADPGRHQRHQLPVEGGDADLQRRGGRLFSRSDGGHRRRDAGRGDPLHDRRQRSHAGGRAHRFRRQRNHRFKQDVEGARVEDRHAAKQRRGGHLHNDGGHPDDHTERRTYTTPQTVSVATTTSGVTLRYTTDNTTPTSASLIYTAPLQFADTTTLKVIGFRTGWTQSTMRTSTYQMNFGTLVAPVISPAAGSYNGSATVTISALAGATIRYMTTGSNPNTSSPIYTAAIAVSSTQTITAIAYPTTNTP